MVLALLLMISASESGAIIGLGCFRNPFNSKVSRKMTVPATAGANPADPCPIWPPDPVTGSRRPITLTSVRSWGKRRMWAAQHCPDR
jgi:hypothetical protein